jgi:dihydroxyacetone kinase-like predicted kinase
MIETINGTVFQEMILSAAAAININKQQVNELNVFPVPDGDTGTNMSLTMGTAATDLMRHAPKTVGKVAGRTAGALLRGARGNSGVILSLLFRGFSRVVKDQDTINGVVLAAALEEGVHTAYRAVMKPAEGTILTVSRVSAKRATEAAKENASAEYVLQETIASAQTALEETVWQNPVLKKAGVIDAGGKGYLIILDGMLQALRGNPVQNIGAEAETVQGKRIFPSSPRKTLLTATVRNSSFNGKTTRSRACCRRCWKLRETVLCSWKTMRLSRFTFIRTIPAPPFRKR